MTYFLGETVPEIAVPERDTPIPTWLQGLGAATGNMMRRTDANFVDWRTRGQVTFDRAEPIARKIGIDALNAWYQENDAGYDHLRPAPESVEDFFALHGDTRGSEIAFAIAREQAAASPENWSGLDLSDEGIEAEKNLRLQAEQEDASAILDAMPSGRGAAEFLGGMVGVTADIRNLPFLLVGGGGGSFLKVMGQEAMLNVAAEAVTIPSQFKMAKVLNEPDPNVFQNLLLAAGAGAIIGGAVEAGARALRYYNRRGVVEPLPGLNRAESEAVVDAAEGALSRGADPFEAVQRVADEAELGVRPFDLDEVFGVARERPAVERMADFTVTGSTETAIPAAAPLPKIDTQAVAERATRYSAAREFDPPAFRDLEESRKRADTFRRWLTELGQEQDREVSDLIASIDTRMADVDRSIASLRTAGRRSLKDKRKQLAKARDEALTLSGRRETRDMAQVRRDLMREDEKMRDLAPRLAAAYRKADAERSDTVMWRNFARPEKGWTPVAAGRSQLKRNIPAETTTEALSAPSSKEGRVILDGIAADFRDQIAKGDDPVVDIGSGPQRISTILADLDKGDAFSARIDLCGMAPGRMTE